MELADELRRRIEKKRREVQRWENDLREGQAYLLALEDTYRLIEGEGDGPEAALRPGSDLAKAQEIIKKMGHPLHVSEILEALGKSADKKITESLSGSLAAYAREGKVFTKAGPNKFGLTEMQETTPDALPQAIVSEPPDDFGGVTDEDVPS